MTLRIRNVVRTTTDKRGEYVEIVNTGISPTILTGLKLTDFTRTQQHVHVITFPGTTRNGTLTLPAGKSVFVFTGRGRNGWAQSGNLLLFAGRSAPVWNNTGDVAYLRRPDGTFVDSMTVGAPARHPGR